MKGPIKKVGLVLCTLFGIQACGNSANDLELDEIDENFQSVSLSEKIDRVQPMTGLVFWASNTDDLDTLGEVAQLAFSYLLYSDVVSQQGVYNWDVIEVLLNDVSAKKRQAILRFRYTYPGQIKVSVPQYIVNQPPYQIMFDKVENKDTFLPDWRSDELAQFTLDFYKAFAERYDGDPRIAMVQVGFGSYGEYHLYDGPLDLGVNFPNKVFQAEFINTLNNSFNITQWSISIDARNPTYSPFESQNRLTDANFGLFDDSFMHQNHSSSDNEYNRSAWLFFGENRYEYNMLGGEFNYYSEYDQQTALALPNGPWGRSFESFLSDYRLSYILGNDQLRYHSKDRIKSASMAMGYKFNIDAFEVSPNSSRIKVRNYGNAPIYYDAFVAVNGIRSEHSLKGLRPGESKTFMVVTSSDAPVLTIESDYLVPGQVIQYSASL